MSQSFVSRVTTPNTLATLLLCCCAPAALILAATLAPARAADDPKPKDELARVQGNWERTVPEGSDLPYRRATKQIKGSKETITFYDAAGKVFHRHTVDFKLSKSGQVRVFTYSNFEVTEGPQKGATMPGSVSYIYRVTENQFREVTGFLSEDEGEDAALTIWTKAAAKNADAAP